MSPYDITAMAIFMFEGGNAHAPFTRNIRNNNPGNLRRYAVGQVVDDGGYRTFPTFVTGWLALIGDIQAKIKNHLKPTATMLDFFNIYAPGADHNDPHGYAQFVCHWIGTAMNQPITVDTPVAVIFGGASWIPE